MVKSKNYKVALYIRVSTEEQAENPEGSIKNQEERLKQIVRQRNENGGSNEIIGVFVDPGLSAKDMKRPGLQRMLQAIRNREVNLVMVTELSRLSRSTKDFCEMWEFFEKFGCEFHSLREHFDTTNAAGELMLKTFANMAEFERRQTAERIVASFRIRAERGLYNGGSVPYGYKLPEIRNGTLEVHEEEAEVVKAAYKAFLKVGSLVETAKWLNEQGYRLKNKMEGGGMVRTGHFKREMLYKILTNKAYLGIRVFKGKDGNWEESKAQWPAIIDPTAFYRIEKILKANFRRKKLFTDIRYPYTLTGRVFCGTCSERLAGKSAHGAQAKYPYYDHTRISKIQAMLTKQTYSCQPHRFPGGVAEEAVWKEVEAILSGEAIAEELLKEAKKSLKHSESRLEENRVKTKIGTVTAKIDALAARLAELPKAVSAAPIYKQMQQLETSKADLETRLADLKRQAGEAEEVVDLETYVDFLMFMDRLSEGGVKPEMRQKIIEKLIHRIELFPDSIKVHYLIGSGTVKRELEISSSLERSNFSAVECSTRLTSGGP